MPTYHRSQRLRLVGTGPKVEQLQEGRFRLTFTCTATNPNEAWMNGNKDQIMTAYGTLQSAQKNIAGIDPRTDEAYSDMVLFRTEANPSERDLIITLVYETATTSFVKSQDDKIDFELNGLKRVTRVTIAKTGTNLPSTTVGTTTLSESETDLILASKSVEENDAFIQITEVYLEQGTVSETIDNVGSQKAKVITTFGADPGTPTDYALASKEESNFSGYQTNTFRFLKPSILSVEESKNTPENRITVRVFDLASDDDSVSASTGAVVDTDTHILVSQSDQDYEGIKTSVYVFESKDYSTQSTNEFGRIVIDQVEQSTGTFQLQDQSNEYTIGVVSNLRILNQRIENDENEVNKRITKFTTVGIDNVREDIVGSQKAIVITKVGAEPTTTEASSYSDIGYDSSSDWSIARKDNSRSSGLDVYTYTFLLNNTILSESQDRQASLKTNVVEVFNPMVTIPGLSIDGGSGIKGDYFLTNVPQGGKNLYRQSVGDTFPKQVGYNSYASAWQITQFSGVFSTSTHTNPDNSDDPPTTGWSGSGNNELFDISFRDFDQTLPNSSSGLETSHRYEKEGYSLINLQKSNVDGIPTMRYTFAKDNSVISVSEDKVGSQNAIVNEIFNPSSETITGVDSDNVVLSGYSEADRTESNYEGIKTIRVRFLKNNAILSTSEDLIGSQKAIIIEKFGDTAPATTDEDVNGINLTGYSIAKKDESNVDGIKTFRYTFLKPSILSRSDDKQNPACPITIVAFDKDETDSSIFASDNAEVDSDIYVLVSKTERDFEGIETFQMKFEKKSYFLSEKQDKFGRIENVKVEQGGTYALDSIPGSAASINGTANSYIVSQEIIEGTIPKKVTTYSTGGILSVTPMAQNEYLEAPMYQYRSIVTSPEAINTTLEGLSPAQRLDDPSGTDLNANAVFFEPTIDKSTSPHTFTQNVLNTSTDMSIGTASTLINQHQDFNDFLNPGLIKIEELFYGDDATKNKVSINTKKIYHPITSRVQCTVYDFLTRSSTVSQSDYTYAGSSGLWAPNSWGSLDMLFVKASDSVTLHEHIPISQNYPGYRIVGTPIERTLARSGTIQPNIVFNGTNYGRSPFDYYYKIKIPSYGPPNPEGRKWCIGVDISPAFRDASGNLYYNKQIVITDPIPKRTVNKLVYS